MLGSVGGSFGWKEIYKLKQRDVLQGREDLGPTGTLPGTTTTRTTRRVKAVRVASTLNQLPRLIPQTFPRSPSCSPPGNSNTLVAKNPKTHVLRRRPRRPASSRVVPRRRPTQYRCLDGPSAATQEPRRHHHATRSAYHPRGLSVKSFVGVRSPARSLDPWPGIAAERVPGARQLIS
jgi:hypothetical protein